MLPADFINQKRDLIVHFTDKETAKAVLSNLTRMNMSLVMAAQPVRDNKRIVFFCVSSEELASLQDLIRETGGNIENIETY